MNKKTLLYLNDFIVNGLYDAFVNKPFITLFKNYVDKEFKNVNDFIRIAEAYVKFIMVNKETILSNYPDLNEKILRSDLNEIAMVINRLKNKETSTVVNNFVRMVEYFINKKTRVLDVGAGALPVSSFELAKKNNNISAMDNFIVSSNLIKKFNVNPIDDYFNYSTDIKDYDFVVGLKPCSAIGHIVSECKKENKPYFVHLCNCGAADYALSKFHTLVGDWRQILPQIDPYVKFVNVYATNIDMPQEKLTKIIYRKCKLTREMQHCGMLSFMESIAVSVDLLANENCGEKEIYTPNGMVSNAKVVRGLKVLTDENGCENEK